MNKGSECITEGIRIQVIPEYIPPNILKGEEGKYYFSYTITIINEGNQWAKLLSRHWIIIDADGNRTDVVGEGVVGYFPELEPGESFTYTSYCPLDTPWGTMEGEFQMRRRNGEIFYAKIERFYLVSDEVMQGKGI